MKPAEKQAVMQSFKQGELHLLVATTVIEVGVDVPNSSLMIIENPERTGWRSSPATRPRGPWRDRLSLRAALQSPSVENRADAFAGITRQQ